MAWLLPALCASALLAICSWAARPPVARPGAVRQITPAGRVMISANVLSTFVSADRGTEHVDSVLHYNATGVPDPLLATIYPGINTLPSAGIGLALDPEIVLLRQPDVVLAWAGRDAGLAVTGYAGLVELQLSSNRQVQQHTELWRQVSRLTSRASQANALLARYAHERAVLKTELARIAPSRTRPSVLLLIGGRDRGYWLGPPAHYLNERFADVGARVLSGRGGGGGASLEHILLLDPDVLFLDASGTGDRMLPAQIYAAPEWRALRAVRARRVYRMPALPSFTLPVEDPIRLRWLAEVLYPDALAPAVRSQVRDTLRQAYGYAATEDDIDRVLLVADNIGSTHGDRFARICAQFPCPAP